MRWINKTQPHPRHGDRRTRSKFLFFPKKCGDEWRWLEFATYIEEHDHDYVNYEEPCWACWYGVQWEPLEDST